MSSPERKPSVSRGAYFGGLLAGITVAVVGYYLVGNSELEGGVAAIVEIALVAAAMGLATGIWKLSAWIDQARYLDMAEGDRDRSDG